MSYLEMLKLASPEAVVVGTALLVLLADLVWGRGRPLEDRCLAAVLAGLAGLFASAFALVAVQGPAQLGGGLLVVDPLSQWVKMVILVLSGFSLMLFLDARFTAHAGEFVAMVLFATAAMMFLVSSEDLLMIFLSLETTSLCLYVMVAFHKESAASAEAALKYFLYGGVAGACLLFGLSLLYGLTGQTGLRALAGRLATLPPEPVFYLALVLVVIGLAFKVAAAPFHLWAPDAYQGAPIPAAALIASGSKVAGFFILAKFMMFGLAGAGGSASAGRFGAGWLPLLAGLAAASMLLGNLAAIVQRSVRRLLAFSAVAQAGYMLVGVVAQSVDGWMALLYYAFTYGLTLVGAFAVVSMAQDESGGESLGDLAGLGKRAPVMSLCLLVFILSLAGIPPLAGFFGKFYLFTAALKASAPDLGLLWLVGLGVVMSVVSLFYYLQVLKQVYVADASEGAGSLKVSRPVQLAVVFLAALVLLLGCAPGACLQAIQAALRGSGF